MKNIKSTLIATALLVAFSINAFAGSIQVVTQNGDQFSVESNTNPIRGRGIAHNEKITKYAELKKLSSDDFDTYETLVRLGRRAKASHITMAFTGDEDYNRLRLEKLQKRRNAGHIARGVGGLVALAGVLSGDRQLTSAGMATYGIGTISNDINHENVIETQSEMIYELQDEQKKREKIEELRSEYGSYNVDAYLALIDQNHKRALALASVAQTSENTDHQYTALWIIALTKNDLKQNNDTEIQEILNQSSDINDEAEVNTYLAELQNGLNETRKDG